MFCNVIQERRVRDRGLPAAHLNPMRSAGLTGPERVAALELPADLVSQSAGAITAAGLLRGLTFRNTAPNLRCGCAFRGNSTAASLIASFGFAVVISSIVLASSEEDRTPRGFVLIAISPALAFVHLVTLQILKLPGKPASRIELPLWVGAWLLEELWLLRAAQIVLIAGMIYPTLFRDAEKPHLHRRSSQPKYHRNF